MGECACYPAERDGNHYNEFIGRYFGECVYSTREIASFVVGMSSLAFWITCTAPQFYTNYKSKSAGALSKWFILEWFLGDALNLAGAVITHQLSTQIATGTLFIINDVLMISQVTYYSYFGRKKKRVEDGNDNGDPYAALLEGDEASNEWDDEDDEEAEAERNQQAGASSAVQQGVRLAAVVLPVAFAALSHNKVGNAPGFNFALLSTEEAGGANAELPSCEPQVEISESVEKLGMAIGWISTLVYLNSRIPQILKNQRRRSVRGLSFLMFGAAVMGNTTYGLGVMLRDSSPHALKKALPWLVGSLGTLSLDFTILLQFWCFQDEDDEDQRTSEEAEAAGAEGASAAAALAARRRSPLTSGLYGMKAWNTSPFFKPATVSRRGMPPLDLRDLRDTTSLGVLPSEQTASLATSFAPLSDGDLMGGRERSGSH
mmetsp:Transcript_7971/g.25360  ORF Transcript_7971/g.25360 Transcript_7971/m.25360 type:complete len:431 (-) Transcript_7971:497-1789(-)